MRKIITLIHAHRLLNRAHGLLNRVHVLLNRAHGLLNRAHGLLNRVHGLLNCAHGLLNRAQGLLNRAHGLIIRAHGLLSRAHGLTRLNNYFPHGTAGAPYNTEEQGALEMTDTSTYLCGCILYIMCLMAHRVTNDPTKFTKLLKPGISLQLHKI